jgi:myo-inositol-1-phosphate synthase
MARKIRVAIVGVGNCASSLIQGISHYTNTNDDLGLITPVIGGYGPSDIEIVGAFDVTDSKVGRELNEAMFSFPNNTIQFVGDDELIHWGVKVQRGPTLDGLGKYLREEVTESSQREVDVAKALMDMQADVLVNYLPVGSEEAARFYAAAALTAKVGFINCMPTFIVSDPEWARYFIEKNIPCIGDDIKSQVGATIVHRALAILMRERGVRLLRTSQLNVGGNADFHNMLERERLKTKKISKTQAVTSVMGVELPAKDVHIGPSDFVPWLEDRKWAHIRLEGEGFGGTPMSIEVKLEVWDSPNSAGVVMDAIRLIGVAQDRDIGGPLDEACAVYMKSPPFQEDDDLARRRLVGWILNAHDYEVD